MRLANISFMDAFHFPTQQPIIEVTLHAVSGQTILSLGSLLSNFAWWDMRKRRLLADDKL
ncbi:MAG: hypothetical protein ACPLW8_01900 [Candidatus Bathyarchaeales archaeon]